MSPVMISLLVGLGVAAIASRRHRFSVGRMVAEIDRLDGELHGWQRAHDHQLAELHRRLAGIEHAADRAADKAYEVSHQLEALHARIQHDLVRDQVGASAGQGVGP